MNKNMKRWNCVKAFRYKFYILAIIGSEGKMIHMFVFQYAGINIGPVHKKDIMKASIMLEHDSQ